MDDNEQMNNNKSPLITEPLSESSLEVVSEEKKEAMAYINFKRFFKQEKPKYGKWYLINKEWIRQWKSKINFYSYKKYRQNIYNDDEYKGDLPEISNAELIIDPSSFVKLKDDYQILIRSQHQNNLKVLNETIWNLLLEKYKGGPEIKVEIKEGESPDQIPEFQYLKINFIIFPLRNEVAQSENDNDNNNDNVKKFELKQYTMYMTTNPTIRSIKERIVKLIIENNLLGNEYSLDLLSNENIRLWTVKDNTSLSFLQDQFTKNKEEIGKENSYLDSNDFDLTYIEILLDDFYSKHYHKDQIICCIERNTPSSQFLFKLKEIKRGCCDYDNSIGALTVCCKCKKAWYCNELCLLRHKQCHELNCTNFLDIAEENLSFRSDSVEGLCGLSNLGNTCFMNTSLQCLSNCFALTEYFITDKYKKDLNEDNPLGSKGIIAKVYASFLKNLWYGDSSHYTPSRFKLALGGYLKMFSGFQQHDTQEFLNYLLDVLHEDLNKVLKKPIVQFDETNMPDDSKSKSHWITFLKRNQSVLVDLFYGQFKSTLTCPIEECKNISITFDPFLSISLPLVSKVKAYTISCLFIFNNAALTPLFFVIPFYKDTSFMAFRNKIGQMLNIHPWSFVITTIKERQSIKELISETKPLHTLIPRDQTDYYLFQIDPASFYSLANVSSKDLFQYEKEFTKDTEDYVISRRAAIYNIYSENYEEDAVNQIGDLGNNNGFNEDFVPTIIQFMDKVRDYLVFPRVMYLNKTMTIKELYSYIYASFYDIMCKPKKETKRYHHPLSNSPEREYESEKNDSIPLIHFHDIFKDIKDKEAFDEAFDNNSIPFYILFLPKNPGTKRDKLYYLNNENYSIDNRSNDQLSVYISNFNKEEDHLCFSVNKLFTLGIVWNRKFSSNAHLLQEYKEPTLPAPEKSMRTINIYECFDRFVKEEVLEENNEWYCPKCKEHRRAKKKIEIYKIPKYLIIHLKRFNNKTKLEALVDFPVKDLDISKYVISDDKDTKFDLIAIANHYGSMSFGHYIAFAKNQKKNKWYEFDDSHVSRKDENDLVSSSAYVLFYSKQSNNNVDWNETYNRAFINYELNEQKEEPSTEQTSQPSTEQTTQLLIEQVAGALNNSPSEIPTDPQLDS